MQSLYHMLFKYWPNLWRCLIYWKYKYVLVNWYTIIISTDYIRYLFNRPLELKQVGAIIFFIEKGFLHNKGYFVGSWVLKFFHWTFCRNEDRGYRHASGTVFCCFLVRNKPGALAFCQFHQNKIFVFAPDFLSIVYWYAVNSKQLIENREQVLRSNFN